MSVLASPGQVRAIQIARRGAGLADDSAYRASLSGFGVVSTKDLTAEQADAFLNRLNGGSRGVRRPSERATGPFAGKLQALWIALYNLGVVRERDDAAMLAFVARQTGVSHTRFLRDPADAKRAIEALKAMAARDAGVAWPVKPGRGAIELKRAVVAAQLRRLADRGVYLQESSFFHLNGSALDGLSASLGQHLRAALAGTAP